MVQRSLASLPVEALFATRCEISSLLVSKLVPLSTYHRVSFHKPYFWRYIMRGSNLFKVFSRYSRPICLWRLRWPASHKKQWICNVRCPCSSTAPQKALGRQIYRLVWKDAFHLDPYQWLYGKTNFEHVQNGELLLYITNENPHFYYTPETQGAHLPSEPGGESWDPLLNTRRSWG